MKSVYLVLMTFVVIISAVLAAKEATEHTRDTLACPSNCNNHGSCQNSICSCNAGWEGSDCSIPIKELAIGSNQTGTVPMWNWQYWKVHIPSDNHNELLIHMEQMGDRSSTDCDLYIKQGALPSQNNYDFRDVTLDGSVKQNISNPRGDYYIGVFAFLQCSYSIKATLGVGSCPNNCNQRGRCVNGVCECSAGWTGADCSQNIPAMTLNNPVRDAVAVRQWKMYKLVLTSSYSELRLTLEQSRSDSDLDLYVRRGAPPTWIEFDYANGTLHSTSTVKIANAAAGEWYVGVWAYACPAGQTCGFTLTAAISDRCPNRCSLRGFCTGTACSCSPGYSGEYCQTHVAPMELTFPYTGYVESFAWNYFNFRSLSNHPIRITVSPGSMHNGDCDLYVKKDIKPTIFTFDYKDAGLNTTSVLDIPSPGSDTWWIGMYGYRTCDYIITIAVQSDTGNCQHGGVPSGSSCICPAGWGGDRCEISVIPLLPNTRPNGHLISGAFDYYNFSVPATPTDLVIYLKETTPNSRGNIWLFMSQTFVPTIRDHAFEDVDTNTDYHMIHIKGHQLPERRTGAQHFIIGVYGSPYLLGEAAYTLTAYAPSFQ